MFFTVTFTGADRTYFYEGGTNSPYNSINYQTETKVEVRRWLNSRKDYY